MTTEGKSVFFLSLHKCATSFFTHSILPHTSFHKHIDYQTQQYRNEVVDIDIADYGCVYGVIRVVEEQHPSYDMTSVLIDTASSGRYDNLFLLRDPRDILVSMYYSFGVSHGFSQNQEIRKYQEKRREIISKLDLDEFSLRESVVLKQKYEVLMRLIESTDGQVLRYEDLIENCGLFLGQMRTYLPISDEVANILYRQTRPRAIESPMSHRRSGKVAGYKEKLKYSTIDYVNHTMSHVLKTFGYC